MKIVWFQKDFLTHGISSHDILLRLIGKLDHFGLCEYFTECMQIFHCEIEKVVMAIDAKALKSSNQKTKGIKSLIELRP